VITLDTSAVVALLDASEPGHARSVATLRQERPPYVLPAGILGEVGYLVESRLGTRVLVRFLSDIAAGAFALDCGEGDTSRIRTLVERYADLPLGFSDAAVIACAERNGGRVLTLDQRDFSVVGREVPLAILPTGA
jgi:predicted nucleic acid-binding protein